jgi:uncharacterized membrane protein YphA (DoxX/SURF4 family)
MKEKLIITLRFILGLMMLNAGLNKFLYYMPMPEMTQQATALMAAFDSSNYMLPMIAVVEIIAALMLFTKKYTALGAMLLMIVSLNILLFHIFLDTSGLIMSSVIVLFNLIVVISEKKKYYPLCGCDPNCC